MKPVGREAELALIGDRLRDRRLVTLVGPGGVGKTTVARAAAAASAARFGEGWVFVDLTRTDSEAGVKETMASQLGYRSYQALLEAPGDRSILVVLDNCEHVVDAAATAAEDLLTACEMPTILATSRVALDVPGEAVVPLGPLALPGASSFDAPAVQLFLERAADAGSAVEPSPVVSELCRRLDGMPLAIELAAARTRSLTPQQILDRLSDSLDVLHRPRRRSAARHRSIRSAIDWSFQLLTPEQQELFCRLSVIPGPFSSTFAHALVSDTVPSVAATEDLLDELVAASMVSADASGQTTAYRVLDTLRAYGRERLEEAGATAATERRLVDHVAGLMTDIVTRGAAGWDADALRDLLELLDSAATAVRWCLDQDDPDNATLITAVLWGAVHQVHTEEIGELAEQVLARWPDSTNPLRADVAATAATCRYMMGDDEGAIALAESALADAHDSPFAGATLRRAIAQATRAEGDAEGAISWFEATAATATELGLMAMALESESARAQVLADLGKVDEALSSIRDTQARAAAGDLAVARAWARVIEGSILLRRDPDAAVDVLEDGRRLSEALAYSAGSAVARRGLALACLLRQDPVGAARHLLDLLDELLSRGSTYELRMVFDVTSVALERCGRAQPARDLAATALTLPVVSITASVGHELFPIDPTGGSPLAVRDAIVLARDELSDLVDPAPAAEDPAGGAIGRFRLAGDVWEVGLGDRWTTVKDSKGMHDLLTLLRAGGDEVHCLELMGAALIESSTGEVLDARARRAYEDQVRELQAEIDEAEEHNDLARADRARAEMDALVDQLAEALGLGGRSRTRGSSAERARSAVTQRIRSTIRRLSEADPALGRHLQASVKTGTYCSYRPEHPVRWDT